MCNPHVLAPAVFPVLCSASPSLARSLCSPATQSGQGGIWTSLKLWELRAPGRSSKKLLAPQPSLANVGLTTDHRVISAKPCRALDLGVWRWPWGQFTYSADSVTEMDLEVASLPSHGLHFSPRSRHPHRQDPRCRACVGRYPPTIPIWPKCWWWSQCPWLLQGWHPFLGERDTATGKMHHVAFMSAEHRAGREPCNALLTAAREPVVQK